MELPDEAAGEGGRCYFEYEYDYLERWFDSRRFDVVASVTLPLEFGPSSLRRWPAFLDDLRPMGSARRWWLRHLNLPESSASDWRRLLANFGEDEPRVRDGVRGLAERLTTLPDLLRELGPPRDAGVPSARPDANPTLDTMNRVLRPFGGAVGLVFPGLEPPPEPTLDVEERRARWKAALAGTRRRKRAD